MRRKKILQVELLESRRLLTSNWQRVPNPLDTDGSGLVVALDVLHVANDINTGGVRQLPVSKPSDYAGPLCDTNGDGLLSGLDALLVVNAINQFPDPPTLNINLSNASDANHDQVVLSSQVNYEGSSTPNVNIKVERLEGEQTTIAFEAQATQTGAISVPLTLTSPINHLRFTISDPRGRLVTTERIVRKGDVVSAWNAALLHVVRETTAPSLDIPGLLIKPPPPLVSRYLAMVHGAMFDAVNAIEQKYEPYLLNLPAQTGASAVAAAAQAAHDVSSSVYNTVDAIAQWDRALTEILNTVPEGNAKAQGIALGRMAASAMVAARANDGAFSSVPYTPGNQPGQWRPTAPGFSAATLPNWPQVKPFAIGSGDAYRPDAPPDLTSVQYTQAFDEVRRLGSKNSSERTVDQTEIANFWADGGGTSTPPGHWNQIAIDVGLQQQLSVVENARMMALLNFALADAGLVAWDAKYEFNTWRPIDAIRQADADGNSSTSADPAWEPLLNTPSFPSYVSGHSTFSSAAATILTSLFGEDFAFDSLPDVGSTGLWPPSDDVSQLRSRSFDSFHQAAQEAGMSRIYGGIHFNYDNNAGLSAGQELGQVVLQKLGAT